MLDRKQLRSNPDELKAALSLRDEEFAGLVDRFLELDEQRRAGQAAFDL